MWSDELRINRQVAENLSKKDMIGVPNTVIHHFCKIAGNTYRDIDADSVCFIDNKKTKVIIRPVDRHDILIPENEVDYDQWIFGFYEGTFIKIIGWADKETVMTVPLRVFGYWKEDNDDGRVRILERGTFREISGLIKIEEDEEEKKAITMQEYVPLHCHNQYSIGDAYGKPEHIAKRLYEKGFTAYAITDHGTLAGNYQMQMALLAKGVKPIHGMEAYVEESDKKYSHLTILVKNETGWLNLLKLNSLAVDNFYYRPRMKIDDILEHKEGLILLSGCRGGVIASRYFNGEKERAQERIILLKREFGEDFYIEIMPHAVREQIEYNKFVYDIAKRMAIKVVVTPDAHYCDKEEKKFHDAITAVKWRKQHSEAGYDSDTYYLLTDSEIYSLMEKHNPYINDLDKILANTMDISDKCNFEIKPPEEDDTLPVYQIPEFLETEHKSDNHQDNYLWHLIINSPRYKPEYKEQIELEYERITNKKYTNYFLIVWDYVKWCQDNDILVGPGRGSVGGSLLAYVIGITNVNPTEYGLIFDRFISEVRRDMPDIDLDFEDEKRKNVLKYIKEKYGEKHCAKVMTFSKWHAKGAMRDIGRIFNIPISEINKLCSLVVTRSGGDARSDYCLEDTFTEFEQGKQFMTKYPEACKVAIGLEGHIRHVGVHAAALCATEKPIGEVVPISKLKGEIVTSWDKKDTEEMKIIKFDILGLKTLSVINGTLKQLKDIELPNKFDDAKVYDSVFKKGKCLGVFQFETSGLSKLCRQLKADDFNLLYDITTLYRPGPLHSGETADYIQRRNGAKEWKHDHELLEPITKNTLGLVLYQEQVMRVMHDIGGFTWATSESTRKVITKSQGKKVFEKLRKEFVHNAKDKGLGEKEAEHVFNVVSMFGSYGFNLSHAVEYTIISYWCAWLKTYHPKEFFAELMTRENDSYQLSNYIKEAMKTDIEIMLPDINESRTGFTATDDGIRVGLESISSIGKKTAQKLVRHQPYKSISDFKKRVKPSVTVVKALTCCGALDKFISSRKYTYENPGLITDNETLIEQTEWDDTKKQEMVNQYVTLPQEKALIDKYDDPFKGGIEYTPIGNLVFKEHVPDVWVKGVVTFINFKQEGLEGDWTMFDNVLERRYAHLNIDDGTGQVLVHLSPEQYTYYKRVLERVKGIPVAIKGHTIPDFQKVYCDALVVMDDVDENNPIMKYNDDRKEERKTLKTINKFAEIGTVAQVSYKVSKNRNPYARIRTKEGDFFMVFKLDDDIFVAGELLLYTKSDNFAKVIARAK